MLACRHGYWMLATLQLPLLACCCCIGLLLHIIPRIAVSHGPVERAPLGPTSAAAALPLFCWLLPIVLVVVGVVFGAVRSEMTLLFADAVRFVPAHDPWPPRGPQQTAHARAVAMSIMRDIGGHPLISSTTSRYTNAKHRFVCKGKYMPSDVAIPPRVIATVRRTPMSASGIFRRARRRQRFCFGFKDLAHFPFLRRVSLGHVPQILSNFHQLVLVVTQE